MNTPLSSRIDTHRAIATTAGLMLVLGLVACGGGGGGDNGPGSKRLDLVIGNTLPLSGSSKALGESGQKASLVALDQIKRAIDSEAADHTVRIADVDQGSDSTAAVDSAKQLVDSDGASCLTGPWTAEAVAEVANEVAIPSKVLQVSPVPAGSDVTDLDDHDLVVSTALPVSLEGEALGNAIERGLGAASGHTVNVAASNDSYGNTVSQDFVDSWQESDGTVSGPIALAQPPSSAQASQITSGSPDAVLLIDDPAGFAKLAPPLSSSGWDPATTWGGDRLASPGLPSEVGSTSIEGMRALAPGAPQDEPATSAFVQAFKSASPQNVKLAPYAAQQFDATVLCYLAAVAAGSTDGQQMADELIDITAPGGTEYSWQQLPGAIKALEDGEDINYTGASGQLDMDVHGNPTDGVYEIYEYTSGRLEVVGEVSVAKANPATP
jgi:branched-chain amino acid transport system substrate-binding protein